MAFEGQECHVAFVQDITQRKRDEEELRRLQSYLFNIINSMPSVLVAVDKDGRVTQWNNQTEQATGLRFEEARTQPLAKVFPRLADEMERIAISIRERRTISTPKVSHKIAQETRFEDITIFPLTANGVEGAVIRLDDVTEQVRMEEMMIQSEKMLSVGGLAAGMAHEINNPLAGILQTTAVLANRLGTDVNIAANRKAAQAAGTTMEAVAQFMEARGIPRMIAAISESGQRVAAIVDNMLNFARKTEATVSSHRLGELLDKTAVLAATDYDLKKQYDFKRIEIQRDYADNLPDVPCEGAKIQQVLLNLLRNGAQAMQAAQTESPRFIFRTWFDSDRSMAIMEIEDNGPGMDEQIRKRVFEPFFTTKPVGVGTGLGLSVSYFIITEHHHGEMAVESRPGAGAKFIIRLPVG
jgi:PAS domain S-box-containing protein